MLKKSIMTSGIYWGWWDFACLLRTRVQIPWLCIVYQAPSENILIGKTYFLSNLFDFWTLSIKSFLFLKDWSIRKCDLFFVFYLKGICFANIRQVQDEMGMIDQSETGKWQLQVSQPSTGDTLQKNLTTKACEGKKQMFLFQL